MHVTAYLKQPAQHPTGPVVAISGNSGHLKHAGVKAICDQILGTGDDDFSLTRWTGKDVDLATVCDELATVSMWGDARIVVLDDADEFITKYRAGLERYLQAPAQKSVLVLVVKSWPKSTKLAKRVDKIGLHLLCDNLSAGELLRWLSETAKTTYEKQLSREAAALMVELAGSEMGLLDQELAKLASYVGERGRIEPDDIQALVGGWKAETTWAMTDAVRDGNLPFALACLDKLLVAGEAPQRIMGGMVFVFRKYAIATELVRQGRGMDSALRDAGVFPRDVKAAERYLRRIRFARAERLLEHLVAADSDLKGGSRLPERLLLERLLVALSGRP